MGNSSNEQSDNFLITTSSYRIETTACVSRLQEQHYAVGKVLKLNECNALLLAHTKSRRFQLRKKLS